MSNEPLEHRGYMGSIEHDLDSGMLFGSVQFVNDVLFYEAETLLALRQAFIDAVDDYIETCVELDRSPDKPYSGTFNVRVSAELHRQLAQKAFKDNTSLNNCVAKAIENYVGPAQIIHKHEHSFSFQIPFDSTPKVNPKTELRLVK